MRISDRSQPTEEKLHQSINLRQENQAKELILSQLVQVAPKNPSLKFMVKEKEKVKKKQHQEHQPQRRLPFYSHLNISIEPTPIPQT
jgi:hypothetical protein